MPAGTDPPAWHVAMGRNELKQSVAELDSPAGRVRLAAEWRKTSIRAKVEHAFRIIKRQFGFTRLRYRGLAKNANHLEALFALANIYKHQEFLVTAA